jgi:hypothetical protein
MGDVFYFVCNFHVPLGSECCLSVQRCRFVMVSIFLCVGLMDNFCAVVFSPGFLFYWCVFCCSSFVVEFLRVQAFLLEDGRTTETCSVISSIK